jgi:hypothetical protein
MPKRQAERPSAGASHKSPARANPMVVRSLCGIVRSSLIQHRSPCPIAPGEGEQTHRRWQDDTAPRAPPALPPHPDIAQNHTQRRRARTGSQMPEHHPLDNPVFDSLACFPCPSAGTPPVRPRPPGLIAPRCSKMLTISRLCDRYASRALITGHRSSRPERGMARGVWATVTHLGRHRPSPDGSRARRHRSCSCRHRTRAYGHPVRLPPSRGARA